MGFFSFCFSAMPPQTKPSSFPTLPEIKSKLPKDCFKSSLPLSLYYVARSAILVVLLFVSVYSICSPASPYYVQNESVRSVAWALYWFIQGTIFLEIFFILLFWFLMNLGELLTESIIKILVILIKMKFFILIVKLMLSIFQEDVLLLLFLLLGCYIYMDKDTYLLLLIFMKDIVLK